MSWVRRAEAPVPIHVCKPPSHPGFLIGGKRKPIEGAVGDLWACDDCGDLWRIGVYCPICARGYSHYRRCDRTVAWLPATWWQRFRNRAK